MAARKKRTPVVPLDMDIETGDLTSKIFPEGVPTNPDGSMASEGSEIDIAKAQKIGAIDGEAAAQNKSMAQRIDRKLKGGTNVPWNEKRALHQFDLIRLTFQPATIMLCFKDLETLIEYPPAQMSVFKTAADLYNHIARFQKGKTSRTYEVIYKDNQQYSNRAIGTIVMPDMLEEAVAAPQPQQTPWQLPPWQQQQMQQSYMQPQQMPYMQQQQPQAAPQPAVGAAPVAQQPPQIIIPPGVDATTAAILQQMQQDSRAQREQMQTLQLQLAGTLGGLEEFKRREAQQQMMPPMSAPWAAPQAPVQAAPQPPPAPVEPYRTVGPQGPGPQGQAQYQQPPPQNPQQQYPQQQSYQPQLIGYDQNRNPIYGYPAHPQQPSGPWSPRVQGGIGAIPPAPEQMPAKPDDPTQQMVKFASMFQSSMQAIDQVRKVVNHGQPSMREAADEGGGFEAPAPEPPVVSTYSLGQTDDSPAYVANADGSPNWPAIAMANAPKIPAFLNGLAGAISKMTTAVETVERGRPINAVGSVVHQPPPRQQLPPIQAAPPPVTVPQQQQAQMPPPRQPFIQSIPVREG